MAKHLLGLIKWKVNTVERKFNPCLGFVPGFLNDDKNEASSQIPNCSRHTTVCCTWGKSSHLLFTRWGSWLTFPTPRGFVKTDWPWILDRIKWHFEIFAASWIPSQNAGNIGRFGAGLNGKHPKGWLPTCSHLFLFMCVHSGAHVDFPSIFQYSCNSNTCLAWDLPHWQMSAEIY